MGESDRNFEGLVNELVAARGCRAGPPATPAFIADAQRRLGAPLPRELGELLQVSAEICERSYTELFNFDGQLEDRGLGPMFRIVDFGNGDGWYLEARGDRCVGWWIGHDPWFVVRLDDSLEAFIARAIANPRSSTLYEPKHRAQASTAAKLLEQEQDPETRSFLESLEPGVRVVDLRGAKLGAEVGEPGRYWRFGDIIALDVEAPARPPIEQGSRVRRLPLDSPRWPRQPIADQGDPERVRELAAKLVGKRKAPSRAFVAAVGELVGPCAELDALLEISDQITTDAATLRLFAWVDDIGLGPMLRGSPFLPECRGYWLLEPVEDRVRVWFHGRNELVVVAGSLAEFLTRCTQPGKLHRAMYGAKLELDAMAAAGPAAVVFDLRAPLASTGFGRGTGWAFAREGQTLVTQPGPDPALLRGMPIPAWAGLREVAFDRRSQKMSCALPDGRELAQLEAWFKARRHVDNKAKLERDDQGLRVTHPDWWLRCDNEGRLEWGGSKYPGASAVQTATHLELGGAPRSDEVSQLVGKLVALGLAHDTYPGMTEAQVRSLVSRLGEPAPEPVLCFVRAAGPTLIGDSALPEFAFVAAADRSDLLRIHGSDLYVSRDALATVWLRTASGVACLPGGLVELLRGAVDYLVAQRRRAYGEDVEVRGLAELAWQPRELTGAGS